MKKHNLISILVSGLLLLNFISYGQEEVNKTFDAKEMIKISTVSGDCTVQKSTDGKISVNLKYTYDDDCFEYIFKETDTQLKIEEDFHGNNCSGKSEWTISVPSNISVKFNSASGDLQLDNIDNNLYANTASGDIDINNIKGNSNINTASGDITAKNCMNGFDISTASGDISAENIKGEIEINAASGNISITNAKGDFTVKNASGSIEANDIELTEESYFASASGDVNITLSKSAAFDLTLSSASGNSILDYAGNEIKGFFEFSARVDKGKIISPIKFDKEEVIEKSGKDYDLKSFTKSGSSPVIKIKTASGEAELKK